LYCYCRHKLHRSCCAFDSGECNYRRCNQRSWIFISCYRKFRKRASTSATAVSFTITFTFSFGIAFRVTFCFSFCLGNSVAIGLSVCNDCTFSFRCAEHHAIGNSVAVCDRCPISHTFSYRDSCGSATTNRIATSSNSGN
jgi:hypothetical protein